MTRKPQGDLERAPCIEPDTEFPDYVEMRLVWGDVGRSHMIRSDEFFGHGGYGAPMSGDLVIRHIERMRKKGAPK